MIYQGEIKLVQGKMEQIAPTKYKLTFELNPQENSWVPTGLLTIANDKSLNINSVDNIIFYTKDLPENDRICKLCSLGQLIRLTVNGYLYGPFYKLPTNVCSPEPTVELFCQDTIMNIDPATVAEVWMSFLIVK